MHPDTVWLPSIAPRLVPGGKPPLATPVIRNLKLRLTSCSATGTHVDALDVAAGALELVTAKGEPQLQGVPSGF